jgi:hypothetical protein
VESSVLSLCAGSTRHFTTSGDLVALGVYGHQRVYSLCRFNTQEGLENEVRQLQAEVVRLRRLCKNQVTLP